MIVVRLTLSLIVFSLAQSAYASGEFVSDSVGCSCASEEDAGVDEKAVELDGILTAITPDQGEVQIDIAQLWENASPDDSLLNRFVRGILRSRSVTKVNGHTLVKWERCGEVVPQEDVIGKAAEWSATFLALLEVVKEETGVSLNPWGAFATNANESSFNECALDFATRKWASEHEAKELIVETWHDRTVKRKIVVKLVDRFRHTYDRETIWKILHDPHIKDGLVQMPNGKYVYLRGKADLGPFQLRTAIKDIPRDKFEDLTTLHTGLYLGIREMARRAIQTQYRYRLKEHFSRPWMTWKGWNAYAPIALEYDRKITSVARWLGARRDEIETRKM